jgi:hypothetical protein
MMIGCTHKGKIYDPPSVLDQRKRHVQDGKGGLDEYTIWPS